MKLAPFVLTCSLVANAACLATMALRPNLAPQALRSLFPAEPVATVQVEAPKKDPKLEAARLMEQQSKLWSTIKSDDLKTLVARLRAAGFPPSVIRAVLNAEIEERYSGRIKALVSEVTDAPYWRQKNVGSYYNPKLYEQMNQLYRERSKLMREVLGDDFFADSGMDPTEMQKRQFGALSKSKIDMVQRISDDYAEVQSQVRAATNGITLPEDKKKMEMIEKEKHDELASLLTPEELEDYEMRNSRITSQLRAAMSLMDATEAEFRTIYRIQQAYSDRIDPTVGMGGLTSTAITQTRQDAEKEMLAQLKATLGEERTAEFVRSKDYEFHNFAQLAKRENLPASAAVQAYDLRKTAMDESYQIYDDKEMNYDQKLAAMKTLAQSTRAKFSQALGEKTGGSYAGTADWLKALERGTSVKTEGNVTYYRTLQPSQNTQPSQPKP